MPALTPVQEAVYESIVRQSPFRPPIPDDTIKLVELQPIPEADAKGARRMDGWGVTWEATVVEGGSFHSNRITAKTRSHQSSRQPAWGRCRLADRYVGMTGFEPGPTSLLQFELGSRHLLHDAYVLGLANGHRSDR